MGEMERIYGAFEVSGSMLTMGIAGEGGKGKKLLGIFFPKEFLLLRINGRFYKVS